MLIIVLEGSKSVIGSVPNTFSSRVVEVGGVCMSVCVLTVLFGEDACLNGVGQGWLNVPSMSRLRMLVLTCLAP